MCPEPSSNGLQRELRARERTARDELATDGDVSVAVLSGESQAHGAAVVQQDSSGALDLEEEGVDGIVDPGQYPGRRAERPGFDLGASLEGPQAPVDHPSCDPPALELATEQPQVHHHEVGRARIERHRVRTTTPQAAAKIGLEVAGEKAFGRVVVAHGDRREPSLEEDACRLIILLRHRSRGHAGKAPISDRARDAAGAQTALLGQPHKPSARAQESRQGTGLAAVRPAGEGGKVDPLQHRPVRHRRSWPQREPKRPRPYYQSQRSGHGREAARHQLALRVSIRVQLGSSERVSR